MLLFYLFFTLVVSVQGELLGSCKFESDTCGYTSEPGPGFTAWTLNQDGLDDYQDGHFISVDGSPREEEEEGGEPRRRTGDQRRTGGGGGGGGGGGRKAVLLSPVLEPEGWSCLRVVYQVSGAGGSLRVGRRGDGESFDRPLWSDHTPSDSWTLASIDLPHTTEPYRVVVEGRAGAGADSSVAVFEMLLGPGYCLECNYEESHLCGYSNQWNTNVNWYVGGAVTRSLEGGVRDDHTYGNGTGHYMYVDSTYAKTFKEVAKMASPMTTAAMSGCLGFVYRRGEERGGNLFSLYTRDQAGQYRELWRAGPDDEPDPREWIPVQVDLKAPYPLQVVFEVAFSGPKGGQVALDDITFSPEFCSAETEPTFDPSVADCDFERDLCRYTQDPTAPWTRVSVPPNVYRTGDHTTGAGSFLLAQSRLALRTGYVSRLFGPVLPGDTKFCLRFFYSLRGFNQTGQALALYLQDVAGTTLERIWTQGERSRSVWVATDVTYQSSKPARVVFVSACQSFWDCGSVALDDISVTLGDCDLTAGLLLSVPERCDFEAGSCGYTQDRESDTGDWVLTRGPTPTSYTGPRGDHTTGRGYYMYIEASPMLPGQNARLLSSPLRASRGPQCLRFHYHMYGSGTGQLSVRLRSQDGGGGGGGGGGGEGEEEEALLWKRTGEQSITWLRAAVEYRSDRPHQIVFEATRGSSVRSDIAIDDIVFESGPCPEIEIQTTHLPDNSNDID